MAKNNVDKNKVNEKQAISSTQDGEIFAEIKQTLQDGSYRKKEQNAEPEEDTAKTEKETSAYNKSKESKKSHKKKVLGICAAALTHELKTLGILAVLGIFTGSGLGVWYFNNNLKSNVNYNLNPEDYRVSIESVFSALSISDTTNWENELIGEGKTPADLTPLQNILLAEHNAKTSSSYYILGTGKVVASMGPPQSIYSCKSFNGNMYATESISKGMLTVASCDTMSYNGSKVTVYQGEKPKETSATWKKSTEMSTEDFKNLSGVLPNEIFPYLFSDKTIESSSEIIKDETSGNYTFTITLKPLESALLYYKQVKRSGDLEADPAFKNIQLTFTINNQWQLVSTEVNETYKAIKFGMGVNCKASITTNYTFDVDVTMPV